tara:strand:+ start:63 stop:536 length:474 start_codon:yes stop_codon:yes gene_type:complete
MVYYGIINYYIGVTMKDIHLDEMRKDFNEFFKTMNTRYKSNFQMKTIRFGGSREEVTEGSFTVQFLVNGQKSKEEKLLEIYAKDYDLDLEKVYNHHQLGKIKLHSYSSTSRKNKYVIECENGKKYKVDYISARKWFGGKPTEGSLTLRDINGRAINE